MTQDDLIKEIANALEEAVRERSLKHARYDLYEETGCCIIKIGDEGTRKEGLTEKTCKEIAKRYERDGASYEFYPGDC